jgi:hypothetical protein
MRRQNRRECVRSNTARPLSSQTIASSSDQVRPHRQCRYRSRAEREARGEVVTVSGDEAHAGGAAPCHDAEAVGLISRIRLVTARRLDSLS